MRYIIAWSVFGLVGYAGYVIAGSIKNPWAVPAAVIQLPPSAPGCSKDCTP